MKIAVPPRRGRLLALCGLSAALHLLCLELVARHAPAETTRVPGAAGPLVLRLAPERAPAAPHADPGAPATQAAHAVQAAPETRAATARAAERSVPSPSQAQSVAPLPEPASTAPSTMASTKASTAAAAPTAAAASALPAPTPDASAATDGGSPSPGNAEAHTLLHYRVTMPPAVRLDYTVTRRDAAGRVLPAPPAWLDWRSDGERYRLEMDSVLGRLSSSGVSSDEGILPQRSSERRDGGAEQEMRFDPDAHRVLFADGTAAPDAPGIQDRGTLLMQLAGIGLARAAQVDGEIEVVVAGQGQARIERFKVMGQEAVDTGAGRLTAWRLAQRSAPGEARLEVWLAPERGWLPVQLRVTEADGASATQVLARIDTAPAPSAQ